MRCSGGASGSGVLPEASRVPARRSRKGLGVLEALAVVAVCLAGFAAIAPISAQQPDDGISDAQSAPLAVKALLLDVAMAGERMVAVGDRGIVLLSDDRGESWVQARKVPTRNLLTAVCFSDAEHGIAVGHDEIVLTTQDGGQSWKRVHYAPEAQQPLLDVWCGQQGRAIAVGAYGAFYSSEDLGASWKARKLDAKPPAGAKRGGAAAAPGDDARYEEDLGGEPHLNRIVEASPTRFYIAGEAGHLFRSDDAGSDWTELASPYEGSFFGILPLDGDALLAFGLRGHLYRSEDAGASWTRIETDTSAMLNDAVRVGAQGVVVVGLSGALLESRDGGRSFELRQQSGRQGLAAVVAANQDPAATGAGDAPEEVVVAGEGGVKRISLAKDGGS